MECVIKLRNDGLKDFEPHYIGAVHVRGIFLKVLENKLMPDFSFLQAKKVSNFWKDELIENSLGEIPEDDYYLILRSNNLLDLKNRLKKQRQDIINYGGGIIIEYFLKGTFDVFSFVLNPNERLEDYGYMNIVDIADKLKNENNLFNFTITEII